MGLQSYERMDIWIQVAFDIQHWFHVLYPYRLMSQQQMYTDNQVYPALTSSLPSTTIKKTHYMTADPGYDDQNLYDLSMDLGFQLVCPVHRYRNTPQERIKLIDFYESTLGQVIYSKRGTSIEPLIEHIKSVFRIDPLPVRGYDKVCALFFFQYCSIRYLYIITARCKRTIQRLSSI